MEEKALRERRWRWREDSTCFKQLVNSTTYRTTRTGNKRGGVANMGACLPAYRDVPQLLPREKQTERRWCMLLSPPQTCPWEVRQWPRGVLNWSDDESSFQYDTFERNRPLNSYGARMGRRRRRRRRRDEFFHWLLKRLSWGPHIAPCVVTTQTGMSRHLCSLAPLLVYVPNRKWITATCYRQNWAHPIWPSKQMHDRSRGEDISDKTASIFGRLET